MGTKKRRMTWRIVVMALLAAAIAVPAAAMAPTESWTKPLGFDDQHNDGAAGPDGSVYVGGTGSPDGLASLGHVIRYDASGAQQWRAEIDAADEFDTVISLVVDESGQSYAVGWTNGDVDGANSGGRDTFVRALSATGATRWTDQFGTDDNDSGEAIAIAPDGSIYVAGSTEGDLANGGGGGIRDGFLRKYTPAGGVTWTVEFGTGDTETIHAMTVADDGTVWVSGETLVGNSGAATDFVSRISSGGSVLDTDVVAEDVPGTTISRGNAIVAHPDGGVVVGGELAGTTTFTGFLRRYAADGTVTWTHQIADTGAETDSGAVFDLDIAADGTIVVMGFPFDGTFEEGFVGAYDSAGTFLWGIDAFSSNRAFVVATTDGGIVAHSSNVLSAPGEIVKLAGAGGPSGPTGPGGFTDVAAGVYYADAVEWLKDEGVTTGTTATTFSPDQTVTRGQMAAFLHRLAGSPTGSPDPGFTDVSPTAFYAASVAWLAQSGVTTGTSPTTYSPDESVTRGQMAAFLWRLAGSPTGSPAHGFGDVPSAAFFSDAVAWLKAQGITTGTAPGVFDPGAVVTRAQMAAFMYRMATDSDWTYPG